LGPKATVVSRSSAVAVARPVGKNVPRQRLCGLDNPHQSRANVIIAPGGRQPPNPRKIGLHLWRMRGNVSQRFVLHDPTARYIFALCLLFAPRRHRLQSAQNFGLARLHLNSVPRIFGIVAVICRIGNPLHFVIQPRAASGRL